MGTFLSREAERRSNESHRERWRRRRRRRRRPLKSKMLSRNVNGELKGRTVKQNTEYIVRGT
jgi:hypothetical protein